MVTIFLGTNLDIVENYQRTVNSGNSTIICVEKGVDEKRGKRYRSVAVIDTRKEE